MIFLADFSVIRPEPGLLIWTTIIFCLFWWLMSKFAFKPIAEGLKKRETDIQAALDEAKIAREEMANLHAQHEVLLNQARDERTAMLKEAKETRDEIIAEAKARANAEYKRKLDSAIQDIDNQKMAAMTDLKNQSGKLAIEIAERVIQRSLSTDADQVAYAQSLANSIKMN